jgi:hypothetical protein
MKKRLVALGIVTGLTLGFAGPAFAGDKPPPPPPPNDTKCNSGGGNNSETTPETDCDPGNSGGHNNGKD